MNHQDAGQFDDPVLKAAVQKAYASESAPQALRQRVSAMASEAAAPAAGRRLSLRRRNPYYGLAAAAILLLAIGVAISQYLGLFSPGSAEDEGNVLTVAIADSMVQAHSACAKLPDHDLLKTGKMGSSMGAIRQAMKEQLGGRPVLVDDLGEGWSFQGAGVCKVGRFQAGHMLFARGDQTISIFSMPPMTYQLKGTGNYEQVHAGYAISGFGTKQGLFCLVAHDPAGGITPADVSKIRDKIRDKLAFLPPNMGSAACPFHSAAEMR